LTAGALLFAFNAGLSLPVEKTVVFSWQMLLIAIGFVFLFSRDKWIAGIILMLVGGFFLLPKLEIERLEFLSQNGWAIALLVVGLFVMYRAIFGKRFLHRHSIGVVIDTSGKKWHSRSCGSSEEKSGYIDRNCVFGGAKEKLDIKNFKGGEVNSVFGGIELDMSEAQLAEGVHYLELNSVFGGLILYVPIEWNIEINQTQFFGSFVDNRPKPSFEVDEKRTLIIEANAVFGGGEIKCK
jgi:predicted membrane protein